MAPEIAERVDEEIRKARAHGRIAQIILDLDGTLFDNVPRSRQILLDRARHFFGPEALITRTIAAIAESAFEYNPIDTLRKHGIKNEEVLTRLQEAWASEFFTSGYLGHDAPLDGAVEAARAWWTAGAELNYVTGRHVPEMFLGTCESLHRAGFPVGTIRTQLLMKPAFDLEDITFKVEAVPHIRRKGPVVLVVDNDPRVLNPLSAELPEAIAVMVRTLHPKDAPELRTGIPVVEGFRSLFLSDASHQ
jgi:hypothetical protein